MRDRPLVVIRMRFQQRINDLQPRLHIKERYVLQQMRHPVADARSEYAFVRRKVAFPGCALTGSLSHPKSRPLQRHGKDLLFDRFHSGRCPPPSRVAGRAAVVRDVPTTEATAAAPTLPV